MDLSFCNRWIDWIMQYIATMSSKIIVNCKMGNSFQPERGIKQGNPLSPYMFIICFRTLRSFYVYSGKIRYKPQSTKDNTKIPYLMFGHDCIIIHRTTKQPTRNLKYILNYYYKVLSRLVNYHKSKISSFYRHQ